MLASTGADPAPHQTPDRRTRSSESPNTQPGNTVRPSGSARRASCCHLLTSSRLRQRQRPSPKYRKGHLTWSSSCLRTSAADRSTRSSTGRSRRRRHDQTHRCRFSRRSSAWRLNSSSAHGPPRPGGRGRRAHPRAELAAADSSIEEGCLTGRRVWSVCHYGRGSGAAGVRDSGGGARFHARTFADGSRRATAIAASAPTIDARIGSQRVARCRSRDRGRTRRGWSVDPAGRDRRRPSHPPRLPLRRVTRGPPPRRPRGASARGGVGPNVAQPNVAVVARPAAARWMRRRGAHHRGSRSRSRRPHR